MKADHFSSQDNVLAFPLSLSMETTGPEVDGPTRFARALKRARFVRGWTQAKLAEQLSITKRSIVSWETGARIPSIGMVVLLLDVLSSNEELTLHQELLCAYIVDDLERQEHRKDPEHHQDNPLLQRMKRAIEQVLQLSGKVTKAASEPQKRVVEERESSQREEHEASQLEQQAGDGPALEPLFTLIDQLHQHPDLIPVVRDFIREVAPNES